MENDPTDIGNDPTDRQKMHLLLNESLTYLLFYQTPKLCLSYAEERR